MEEEKLPKRFKISNESWMYMIVFGIISGTLFDGWYGYIIGASIGWSFGVAGQKEKKEECKDDRQCLND